MKVLRLARTFAVVIGPSLALDLFAAREPENKKER
jgi:hypothetical protein